MEINEKKMKNLEDLIDELGGVGRFQVLLFIGMYSIFLVTGWSMMQMMYSGMIPPWHCVTSETMTSGEEAILSNATFSYKNHNETLVSPFNATALDLSPISENNETLNVCAVNGTKCEMFVFLTSSRTIINEWNLVCDLKWVKQIALSVQMGGVWLGAVVSGQLGDRYGRKNTFFSFSLCHLIMNVIGGFSKNWQMFVICRFLIGAAIGAVSVVAFPYALELYPMKARPFLGFIPVFATGMCIFSGVALLLDNWSYLHFACAVFNLPQVFCWFFLPDSVRWLAVHGKLEEAMDAVRTIARFNRKPVPIGTIPLLKKIAQEEQEIRQTGKAYSYIDIFRNSAVRKVTLIGGYFWFSLTVVFFGISFGVSNLDGNIFLNSFLMSVMAVGTSILLIFIVDLFRRRIFSLILSFTIVILAVACVIVLVVSAIGNKGEIINGLSLTMNMLSYPLWNLLNLWSTELLPTVVRNLGYGFFNTASRIAGITLPFIMNFDDFIVIPYVAVAALVMVCLVFCFFLPETRGQALADSFTKIAEGETDRDLYLDAKESDHIDTCETPLT